MAGNGGSEIGNRRTSFMPSSFVTRHGLGSVLAFPGNEKNQRHTRANRGISEVERGEANFITTALLQVKAQEIHDFVLYQTVGQVPGDAAKDKPERDLTGEGVGAKMMPREKEGDQGQQGDEDERVVVAAEYV